MADEINATKGGKNDKPKDPERQAERQAFLTKLREDKVPKEERKEKLQAHMKDFRKASAKKT